MAARSSQSAAFTLAYIHICFCSTCLQVRVLLRHVLALVDPLAVAFEENLKSRTCLTAELDGVALDDVSVHGFLQKTGQGHSVAVLLGLTPGT